MISLKDIAKVAKKGGIIDDSTEKYIDFDTVLGFCWLRNGTTGLLFKGVNYTIREAYMGQDKVVHLAEWEVSDMVTGDMTCKESMIDFNKKVQYKCRRVKKALLLDDTFIQMEEYLWNF